MLLPVILFASLTLMQQIPPAGSAPPATPAPAEAQTSTRQTADAPRPQAEPAQVCRTEQVTGSRFGRRVCRSAVETADDRRNSQEMLRQMQGARMPDGG